MNAERRSAQIGLAMTSDQKWAFEHECGRNDTKPTDVLRMLAEAYIRACKDVRKMKGVRLKWPYELKMVREQEVDVMTTEDY